LKVMEDSDQRRYSRIVVLMELIAPIGELELVV
jgi:hypothetical protein